MDVYIIVYEKINAFNCHPNASLYNCECCGIYHSLNNATKSLVDNGYKINNEYKRYYTPVNCDDYRVSDLYWHDYENGIVSCSWIEKHDIDNLMQYISNKYGNMWRRCCNNCMHWRNDYIFTEIYNCTFGACECDNDDCPTYDTFMLESSNQSSDKVCCEYFDLCKHPSIEYYK